MQAKAIHIRPHQSTVKTAFPLQQEPNIGPFEHLEWRQNSRCTFSCQIFYAVTCEINIFIWLSCDTPVNNYNLKMTPPCAPMGSIVEAQM